jgi:outer membrane lipoprotein
MTSYQRIRFLTLSLFLLVATGCATRPIAKEYRQQAAAEGITFPMVLQNPDAYVGKVVLWGGSIIETKNLAGGTNIIVLQTPLDGDEKPVGTEYSQGRFIAHATDLLDPEIYQRGRMVTLAGVVSGKEALPLGTTTYAYPVVAIKQLHLWKKPTRYPYPYYYYDYWGPYWGWGPPYWGWGAPYWGWGPSYGYFNFYGRFDGRKEWHGHHGHNDGHHGHGGRGVPGARGGGQGYGKGGGHGATGGRGGAHGSGGRRH